MSQWKHSVFRFVSQVAAEAPVFVEQLFADDQLALQEIQVVLLDFWKIRGGQPNDIIFGFNVWWHVDDSDKAERKVAILGALFRYYFAIEPVLVDSMERLESLDESKTRPSQVCLEIELTFNISPALNDISFGSLDSKSYSACKYAFSPIIFLKGKSVGLLYHRF